MKKLKKIVSVCLTIILLLGMLFSMTGCNMLNKRTKWYNERTLAAKGLEGLPKPDFKYKGHDNWARSIDGNITEEAFNDYAQELFTYMDEKFEYLGTAVDDLGYDMFKPSNRFVNCERKLENYRQDFKDKDGELIGYTYMFVYFMDAPSEDKNWSTRSYVNIHFSLKGMEEKAEKDDKTYVKYTYNFSVSLTRWIGQTTEFIDVNSKIEDYYEKCYPDCGEAKVVNYYGKHNDYNYYAVMMTASNESYDEAIWTETVGDFVFHYSNGNRILITNGYNDEFYTLTEAYEKGLLWRKGDLAAIEAKHRELYPYLYD